MKSPFPRRTPVLMLAAVLACSRGPAEPAGTGSLVLEIVPTEVAVSSDYRDSSTRAGPVPAFAKGHQMLRGGTVRVASPGMQLLMSDRSAAAPPLDRVEVRLTGPTNRTVTLENDGTAFEGTIDELTPGLYQVAVVGSGVGEVTYFGRTTNVRVNANETTTANVAFNSFVTTLEPFATPTLSFTSLINFPLVPNATIYRIEVDTDPNFPNPAVDSVPDNDGWAWFVLDVGTYHLRIRAGNAGIPAANAAASNVELFEVVADTVGDDWTQSFLLGPGSGASGSYFGNITPGDQDWYEVNLNGGDEISVRVLSTSLLPASRLDPVAVIQDRLQQELARNDDEEGIETLESYIPPLSVLMLGPYNIGVLSHNDASVGHYELVVSINGAAPERVRRIY